MQLEIIEYPEAIISIREIAALKAAIDAQTALLADAVTEQEDNLLVATSRESGIARREKILGITPLDTDTLEERRFRVMANWYDSVPYTEKSIRWKLDQLVGEGQYILTIDYANQSAECKIDLASKKNLASVLAMLNARLPLHMILEVSLLYNHWEMLESYTWGDLETLTWGQISNEVLPTKEV